MQGSQAQNSQQSGIEQQMSAESKLEKLRTAHAAEQQERERVATSKAERLLQELEREGAGRAAKAGNKKRRKKKRRGGAQDAQQASGIGAAGAESISGEQENSDEEAGFVIPEQEQEPAHDQQSRQMEGEAQEGKYGCAQPAPDIAAPAAVVPEDMECCVCMSAKVSWCTREVTLKERHMLVLHLL